MDFNPNIEDNTEINKYLGINNKLSPFAKEAMQLGLDNESAWSTIESSNEKTITRECKKYIKVDRYIRFKPDTLLLKLFKRKKGENMPPKKEYLRCQLIRGQKRSIRKSYKGVPLKGFHRVLLDNPKSLSAYKSSQEVCLRNPALKDYSDTINGPETDGKSKRLKTKVQKMTEQSFNNKFCYSYFQDADIREHYYYYTEILFADFSSESLCEKFGFKCCEGSHSDNCTRKWQLMKIFISDYMLTSIGVTPWFPEGHARQQLNKHEIEELLEIEAFTEDISAEDIPEDFLNN